MGVGVEYRLLIERPGLHPAHAFLTTEDKEYIERRLRQERDRYRTWEPSARIWMEQREVAAWTAVDAVSGRFAVSGR